MSTRTIGFWSFLVLGACCATAAAAAEGAAPASPSNSDILRAVTTMSTRVELLASELQRVESELAAVQRKLGARSPASQAGQSADGGGVAGNAAAGQYVTKADLDQLKLQLSDLVQVAKDRSDLLETVVADISTNGGAGRSIPDVHAIMQDPSGREAMDQAVHEVMKRSGTLVVENRLDSNYRLLLNNQTYIDIGPRETKRIPVALGTITTELVGFEAPKNWSVGPPNYEQSIVIGPKPTQPVVIAPPVSYYWDPLWGWVAVQ